jgi:hypothetical protein
VASEQVFSEYFGFPYQNRSFQQLHPHNHPGKYNRPGVAAVASEPSIDSTPPPILQAGTSRVRLPIKLILFFNLHNPSSGAMVLGSTQLLTEMSTRNLPKGKGRTARKADNLTAICETIIWIKWESRRLTTL